MKEYTTEEIFNELWKRIEYDANVSEELASESNELQRRIDKMNDTILTEIFNFCEECSSHEECPEEECVLYRIEKIIEGVENE